VLEALLVSPLLVSNKIGPNRTSEGLVQLPASTWPSKSVFQGLTSSSEEHQPAAPAFPSPFLQPVFSKATP
jgi:hypothetical protein